MQRRKTLSLRESHVNKILMMRMNDDVFEWLLCRKTGIQGVCIRFTILFIYKVEFQIDFDLVILCDNFAVT